MLFTIRWIQEKIFSLRKIDTVRVMGKKQPVGIYEAFDSDPEDIIEKKLKNLDFFHQALEQYKEGNFSEAMKMFSVCFSECSEDNIAKMYIKRCERLMADPPGDNWRGVSRMSIK